MNSSEIKDNPATNISICNHPVLKYHDFYMHVMQLPRPEIFFNFQHLILLLQTNIFCRLNTLYCINRRNLNNRDCSKTLFLDYYTLVGHKYEMGINSMFSHCFEFLCKPLCKLATQWSRNLFMYKFCSLTRDGNFRRQCR